MNKAPELFRLRVMLQLIVIIFFAPFLPMIVSGRWKWIEAWIYAIVAILAFVISRILAARRHPDLLVERSHFLEHKDAKPFDKILAPLLGLGSAMIPLVAGIDALPNPAPQFPPTIKILSLIAIVIGYALSSYALIENRFFSGVVRIQTDRSHKVVSGGPYRWIRHPGYAGGLLASLATPSLLDSTWAYLPAGIITFLVILRIMLEEKTLSKELDGYRDYLNRVRFRIVPGIW